MNIFVHCPSGLVQKIFLLHHETVGSIEERLKYKDPLILLHNNRILEKEFSLEFYSMQEGDHVFCALTECASTVEFFQKFNQPISIKESKDAKDIKAIYLRMIDLSFNKAHSSFVSNRKLTNAFKSLQDNDVYFSKPAETIIPPKRYQISSDPLPKFW